MHISSQLAGWLQNHRIQSQRGTFWHYLLHISAAKAVLVYMKRFLNAKFGNSTSSSSPPGPVWDGRLWEAWAPWAPAEPPSMPEKCWGRAAPTRPTASPAAEEAPLAGLVVLFLSVCVQMYIIWLPPGQPGLISGRVSGLQSQGGGPGGGGGGRQRKPPLIRSRERLAGGR